MEKYCREAYDSFVEKVKADFEEYADRLVYEEYEKALDLILESQKNGGRIHISGIESRVISSGYAASLMSSTGNPAYFLHGTEAVHGSCGQLVPGDVVIFISNSGETPEMKVTVKAVKNNGRRIIGISGNPESWLAKESDVHIFAGVKEEGGPLNRAPRLSVLAETFALQALSVVLQRHVDVTPGQYVKWHPGGKLGELRKEEMK